MTEALALSYGQQLAVLRDAMASLWQWPSPETGFSLYAFRAANTAIPIAVGSTAISDEHRRRLVEAPMLAAAGYLLREYRRDTRVQTEWAAGFGRLTTRQAFPRDRESFFYRPLELLGICIGASDSDAVPNEHKQWLIDVINQGREHANEADLWTQLLRADAAYALGLSWPLSPPRLDECQLADIALLVWLELAKPKLLESMQLYGGDQQQIARLLLQAALAPLPHMDASRAAVLHIALSSTIEHVIRSATERYWQLGRSSRDGVDLVRTLCSRFHLFALQLQKRHAGRPTVNFDDEYDVQDVLHALLRLHFDDVRPEEWTPSYAGSSSRTDFLLKREQVVIETKITRTSSRTLRQREVADQLIIDIQRYQAHPDCKTLVCFVYDPTHVCDNAAALERDLASDGPPMRVVVVVAPIGT